MSKAELIASLTRRVTLARRFTGVNRGAEETRSVSKANINKPRSRVGLPVLCAPHQLIALSEHVANAC